MTVTHIPPVHAYGIVVRGPFDPMFDAVYAHMGGDRPMGPSRRNGYGAYHTTVYAPDATALQRWFADSVAHRDAPGALLFYASRD